MRPRRGPKGVTPNVRARRRRALARQLPPKIAFADRSTCIRRSSRRRSSPPCTTTLFCLTTIHSVTRTAQCYQDCRFQQTILLSLNIWVLGIAFGLPLLWRQADGKVRLNVLAANKATQCNCTTTACADAKLRLAFCTAMTPNCFDEEFMSHLARVVILSQACELQAMPKKHSIEGICGHPKAPL